MAAIVEAGEVMVDTAAMEVTEEATEAGAAREVAGTDVVKRTR